LPKHAGPEGCSNKRFPLTLEMRYSATDGRGPEAPGSGRTIDVSSSGLTFTADRKLAAGQKLDVSIDWPVALDGGVQLQLILSGVVVQTDGTTTALRIQRHEFRTRSLGPKVVAPRRFAR
jgi:hypothetical protein